MTIGRSINLSAPGTKGKKVKDMKEKDKELYEKTVEDLKKLDRNTLVMLNVSIKMLVARQEMDENKPTTAV